MSRRLYQDVEMLERFAADSRMTDMPVPPGTGIPKGGDDVADLVAHSVEVENAGLRRLVEILFRADRHGACHYPRYHGTG